MEALDRGSPVGLGIFLAGLGLFLWGFASKGRDGEDRPPRE